MPERYDEVFRPSRARRPVERSERRIPAPSRSSSFRRAQSATRATSSQRVYVRMRYYAMPGRERSTARSLNGYRDRARKHLEYLTREGVALDATRGKLFGPKDAPAAPQPKDFLRRSDEDKNQFRFIISPERGDKLDLQKFARDYMDQLSRDLRRETDRRPPKLDWVAVAHYNTDNPHIHITLRGAYQDGSELRIPKAYARGRLRSRAEELATRMLGPRSLSDELATQRRNVALEKWTQLDRRILELANDQRVIHPRDPAHGLHIRHQKTVTSRLENLYAWGVAHKRPDGSWQIAEDAKSQLTQRAERKLIEGRLQAVGARPQVSLKHIDTYTGRKPVVGEVVAAGIHSDAKEAYYAIVRASDGQHHYAVLTQKDTPALPNGSVVTLQPKSTIQRGPSDKNIAAVAAANGGHYSVTAHRKYIQTHDVRFGGSLDAYLGTHKRRVEKLQREGLVPPPSRGTWSIPPDLHVRIERHAKAPRPLELRVLSAQPLTKQATYPGMTWLDWRRPQPMQGPFAKDLEAAQSLRTQWLQHHGLATVSDGRVEYAEHYRERLETMERTYHTKRLAAHYQTQPYISSTEPRRGVVLGRYAINAGEHLVVHFECEKQTLLLPAKGELAKLRTNDRVVVQSQRTIDGRRFDVRRALDVRKEPDHTRTKSADTGRER